MRGSDLRGSDLGGSDLRGSDILLAMRIITANTMTEPDRIVYYNIIYVCGY